MARLSTLVVLSLLGTSLGHQLWATKQVLPEAGSGAGAKLQEKEKEQDMILKMPEWISKVVPEAQVSLAEGKIENKEKSESARTDVSALTDLEQLGSADAALIARLGKVNRTDDMTRKADAAKSGKSLRPVVQAKVRKVMNFVLDNKESYESSDSEGRKRLMQQLQDKVLDYQGVEGFDYALCMQLWNTAKVWASELSFWNCPSLIFPDKDTQGIPKYQEIVAWKPSKLKAAWLSQYMILSTVGEKSSGASIDTPLCEQIADDAMLWNGNTYNGKRQVCTKLADQGWPTKTEVKGPEYWQCNDSSCTVPVKAWAEQTCTTYMKFDGEGKLKEMHLPLPCWR